MEEEVKSEPNDCYDWHFIHYALENEDIILTKKYEVYTDVDVQEISCLYEYPKNNFVDSLETDDYFEDEICLKIHPDKVDKDMIDNLFNNIDYDIRKDKYSSKELKEIDLPVDYDAIIEKCDNNFWYVEKLCKLKYE